MNRIPNRLTDESGSVLVIALLMLVFLTLLGIASTTTTSIELQIAQNERIYQKHFNAAEAAALHAVQWISEETRNVEDYSEPFYTNFEDFASKDDALEFFRNPQNWDDSNSAELLVEDEHGNVMYPNTRYAVLFFGTHTDESVAEDSDDTVKVFHCFALYRLITPGDPNRGEVIIEMGLKRLG